MRPRYLSLGVCGWVLLMGWATGFAQESRPAALKVPLKPVRPGSVRFYFFEHTLAGQPVGYSEMSLGTRKEKGKPQYRYRHLMDLIHRGRRITTSTDAKLTPGFRPLTILLTQKIVEPNGDESSTERVTTIEADGIVLTKTENGKTETRRVPLPPVEFVYGLAMLLERVDYEKIEGFSLAELNAEDGTAFMYTFSSEVDSDNVRTITATWGVKGRNWHFTLDAEGGLSGWGKFPPEVGTKRTSIGHVKELAESLGLK